MSTNQVIDEMVRRIRGGFDPEKIILFGSFARGTAGRDSDIDLLVVLSHVENRRRSAIDIRRTLADLPVSKDIIVATPDDIARNGDNVGSILRPALREGKVLYERHP